MQRIGFGYLVNQSRLLATVVLLFCVGAQKVSAEQDELSLSSMIGATKNALVESQKKIEANQFIPLCKVEIQLKLIGSFTAAGKVNFWVARAGGESERTATSDMTMVLLAPDATGEVPVSPAEKIQAMLTEAIFEGASAHSAAALGEPELKVQKFDIEISFLVEADGEGGVELAFPGGLGVEAGVSASQANTQRIKLSFNDGTCPK
ncbi:trypco2 family protein [Ruegeria sp. HKCCC2117]|uniref:trypco2 family protein n=1 Tax=Ruegeria sp. HKCCC2117 TaxID=2682992 RepID=UPI00148906C8|nr:trypco2 family protein [Ruegeria sp. HKCCC2117]